MRKQSLTVGGATPSDVRFLAAIDTHMTPHEPNDDYVTALERRHVFWKDALNREDDKPLVLVARDSALYVGYIMVHETLGVHMQVPEREIKEDVVALLLDRASVVIEFPKKNNEALPITAGAP